MSAARPPARFPSPPPAPPTPPRLSFFSSPSLLSTTTPDTNPDLRPPGICQSGAHVSVDQAFLFPFPNLVLPPGHPSPYRPHPRPSPSPSPSPVASGDPSPVRRRHLPPGGLTPLIITPATRPTPPFSSSPPPGLPQNARRTARGINQAKQPPTWTDVSLTLPLPSTYLFTTYSVHTYMPYEKGGDPENPHPPPPPARPLPGIKGRREALVSLLPTLTLSTLTLTLSCPVHRPPCCFTASTSLPLLSPPRRLSCLSCPVSHLSGSSDPTLSFALPTPQPAA